jgi:hypothetical protein
MIQNN